MDSQTCEGIDKVLCPCWRDFSNGFDKKEKVSVGEEVGPRTSYVERYFEWRDWNEDILIKVGECEKLKKIYMN